MNLVRHQLLNVRFNIIGSKGGHGFTMMKNKILRFVLHVLLPTRIITCILSLGLEKTFVSTGFSNWKDAIAKFSKHEGSQCHKDSVLKTVTLPTTSSDVGEMLSSKLAKERMHRRKFFLKLLSNARFLARQGLAFRGKNDKSDSNFMRLIHLRSEDNRELID